MNQMYTVDEANVYTVNEPNVYSGVVMANRGAMLLMAMLVSSG